MDYKYDVFISHAVEDKIPLVNELYRRLEQAGLEVWYSGSELNAGDSIVTSIHEGLDNSRYAIVILSPNYVSKNWPLREFYRLLAREKDGHKIILPVLYNITPEQLAVEDLTMADKMGIKTEKGLDYVVEKILNAINKDGQSVRKSKARSRMKIMGYGTVLVMIFFLFHLASLYRDSRKIEPTLEEINQVVRTRIDLLQGKIEANYLERLKVRGAVLSSRERLDSAYNAFQNYKASYRNEYEFYDGNFRVRAKKNVNAFLSIEAESLRPFSDYSLDEPIRYILKEDQGKTTKVITYALVNTVAVKFSILNKAYINDSTCSLKIKYNANIRYIQVKLLFDFNSKGIKRHEIDLVGLSPEESYILSLRSGKWAIPK